MERVATQLRVSIIKRYFQAVCCRFRLQNLHVVENRRRDEMRTYVEKLKQKYESIILIASSIGAFFSMNSGVDEVIEKAYFISPIVDMEQL